MDCDFDRLDLSTNPYLEKNLEFLCNWIDDLSNEQQKFNQYTRNVARQKQVWYNCKRGEREFVPSASVEYGRGEDKRKDGLGRLRRHSIGGDA